jgi:putative ubiquitin-RnfH superfamily antitoxin RatB of RatAB toxin-antitoxin module
VPAELIPVEVAYARPDEQVIIALDVEPGTTVEEAIKASGILARFPEIDLKSNKVGVFGKLTKLASELRPKDRVEIYRALIADPKEVRKQRAAAGKRMKKGGGDLDEEKKPGAPAGTDQSATED